MLRPWEVSEYTFDELMITLRGNRNARSDHWQHTRALAYVMAKPYLKNKNTTIEQFWPLPGDKVQKTRRKGKRFSQMSKEEQQAELQRITEHEKQKEQLSDGK